MTSGRSPKNFFSILRCSNFPLIVQLLSKALIPPSNLSFYSIFSEEIVEHLLFEVKSRMAVISNDFRKNSHKRPLRGLYARPGRICLLFCAMPRCPKFSFPYLPLRSHTYPYIPLPFPLFPYIPLRSPKFPYLPLPSPSFPYLLLPSPTFPYLPLTSPAFAYLPLPSLLPLTSPTFLFVPLYSPTFP